MAYNYVQTFFLPANAVDGSSHVLISSVDLYIRQKPNRNNNRSGLENPTINVSICPADRDKPIVKNPTQLFRSTRNWDSVNLSNDSTVATTFVFDPPVPVITDNYYGIYIQAADDDYILWEVTQGHRLVNTNTPTSGPHGRYDGYLFEGTGDTESFRALSHKDLKFGVNLARFSANTAPSVGLIPEDYEFLSVDRIIGKFLTKEAVFQDAGASKLAVPVYADLPGTLSINASSTRIVGRDTDFVTNVSNGSFIVLSTVDDANTYALASVSQVVNSTVMILESAVPITSNGFNGSYRVSPVAAVYDSSPYYGRTSEMVLFRSTANSTHRFISAGLKGITVSNTGAGYSNTNIIRAVNPDGEDAVFQISTTNAGSISSLRVLNTGDGFIAPVSNVRIEVSISDPTLKAGNPGANAEVAVSNNQIGLTMRGFTSAASANVISVDNKQLAEIWPSFQEINTTDSNVTVTHAFSNGAALGVSNSLYRDTRLNLINNLRDYPATIASKSNEVSANSGTSSRFEVDLQVNKSNQFLFESPFIDAKRATVITYENDINNDATNEHTNTGNAVSKYVGKRISFNRETSSEDLIVYLRAARPTGTDIKVYAKLHNNADEEAFDDKLWTELVKVTPDVFTPVGNDSALTTIEYTIPQYPEVETDLSGLVSTANNSLTITGVGTEFSNTLNGRLLRIYSPLQPTNHQVVSVANVVSNTSITLGSPVVNNSIQESVVGSGLKVQLLKYTGAAYNNILNDNVSRYHSRSNQAEIDGFDTFAIKVVFLSSNKYIVPVVEDLRMIGVSA